MSPCEQSRWLRPPPRPEPGRSRACGRFARSSSPISPSPRRLPTA